MIATQFYQHAHEISVAVMAAIGVYCEANGIKWDPAAFAEQAPHDIDQLGKDALFYGAEIFPNELA